MNAKNCPRCGTPTVAYGAGLTHCPRCREGERYVRQYWTRAGRENWALWERLNGKAKRVGTARSTASYLEFLGLSPDGFTRLPDSRRRIKA